MVYLAVACFIDCNLLVHDVFELCFVLLSKCLGYYVRIDLFCFVRIIFLITSKQKNIVPCILLVVTWA